MRAFITGITGQDGSYLAEFLLGKGYQVIGMKRRSATRNLVNIEGILGHKNFTLVDGDVTDYTNFLSLVTSYRPDEIYNLAAQSHVGISFKEPLHTFDVSAKGCINILEVIKYLKSESYSPRFYQASTSEMFGNNVSFNYDILGCVGRYDGKLPHNLDSMYLNRLGFINSSPTYELDGIFQDELTPFAPQSPYAVAKVTAHQSVALYRKAYGLYASSGILMNHESPRRGENFVTRKITKYCANLYLGLENKPLLLGNLEAKRDWGHAKDYVQCMWLMLQQKHPDDYVVSTEETHSVRELCDMAFSYIGKDYKDHIVIDEKFIRPSEVPYLLGKSKKAREVLGWKPKYTFKQLIEEMINHDIKTTRL